MGILSGNPKDEPLHYGEIFSVWSFSSGAKLALSAYQTLTHHAGDRDLKSALADAISQCETEISECDKLLTDNGIAPAPALPAKPEAKWDDIPPGARFADPEIAAKLSSDCAMGITMCSQIMGQSVREDVGVLFEKYHTKKAALGLKMLRMSKEKGWLVPPPLQIKRPELVEA